MTKTALPLLAAVAVVMAALADYTPPTDPPVRGYMDLTPSQVKAVLDKAPDTAVVAAPVRLLRQTGAQTNLLAAAILATMADKIAESKRLVPGAENLTDLEVAELYAAQMTKSVELLIAAAPTNTIEYLIGAGMAIDIAEKDAESEE